MTATQRITHVDAGNLDSHALSKRFFDAAVGLWVALKFGFELLNLFSDQTRLGVADLCESATSPSCPVLNASIVAAVVGGKSLLLSQKDILLMPMLLELLLLLLMLLELLVLMVLVLDV